MNRNQEEGCLMLWVYGFVTFLIGMLVCYFCVKFGWIVVT